MKKVFGLIFLSVLSWAQEEELNLDEVKSTPPATFQANSKELNFKLMGRLDLTLEYGNPEPTTNPQGSNRNSMENNHMFIFLKIKASEKTSIMAEVANQNFFYAEYAGSLADFQIGNILVPFGDNRRYHLFYGGLQGYGVNGVMFANVWSEPGFNVAWKLKAGVLDTYIVNSISASAQNQDPDFQSTAQTSRQALGLRYSATPLSGWNVIVSGYTGEYWPDRRLNIVGLDVYTDYGAFGFFKDFRLAAGWAGAEVLKAPETGTDFNKKGDYVELSTRLIGPGEARVRYGTYIDNSKVESNLDIHNWNVGYLFQVDAFHVLLEHQLNMEAINEKNNDITRAMISVNF